MAPNNESRPPTLHARYTSADEPTSCIISRGTRKMPLPMMVPTTIAVASLAPNTRGKSAGGFCRRVEGFWLICGEQRLARGSTCGAGDAACAERGLWFPTLPPKARKDGTRSIRGKAGKILKFLLDNW